MPDLELCQPRGQESTERFTEFDKLNLIEFDYGGLFLGSRQFLILPQLPQKLTLASKVA
jgi:hypothetical protein